MTANTWAAKAATPSATYKAQVCAIGTKIYIVGGGSQNGDVAYNTNYEWNQATNVWTSKAGIPVGVNQAAHAVVGSKMYIMGGNTGSSNLVATNQCWDQGTNTWSVKAALPGGARWKALAAAVGTKIYMVGGSPTAYPGDGKMWAYDTVANTWSAELASCPQALNDPHYGSGMCAIGTKIYVLGTNTTTGAVNQFWCYDTVAGTWSLKAAGPNLTGSYVYGLAAIGPTVLATYYHTNLGVQAMARYNPVLDSWISGLAIIPAPNAQAGRGHIGVISNRAYVADNAYGVTLMEYDANQAPVVTLSSPVGSTVIDRTIAQRFTWAFADADSEIQLSYEMHYREQGTIPWTTLAATTPNNYLDIAAYALGVKAYEWEVRAYDPYSEPSQWTATGFFSVADPPGAPSITSPANNAFGLFAYDVVWAATQQQSYQVMVVGDIAGSPDVSVVYSDTGEIVATLPRTINITSHANNSIENVRIRTRYAGLWSAWATVRVQVAYTPPLVPAVTITPADVGVLGFTHSLSVVVVHPVPSGGSPVIANQDVWVRKLGDTDEGIRIFKAIAPASFNWGEPASGVTYQMRLGVWGVNGAFTMSPWVTAIAACAVRGVLLHDPHNIAGSLLSLIYNDSGASDTVKVESALLDYQGREFPVVEFGDSTTRVIDVPTIFSDGPRDAAALRALILQRLILCYRDKQGRKVYGMIEESSISDKFYGGVTSINLTAVDYTESV